MKLKDLFSSKDSLRKDMSVSHSQAVTIWGKPASITASYSHTVDTGDMYKLTVSIHEQTRSVDFHYLVSRDTDIEECKLFGLRVSKCTMDANLPACEGCAFMKHSEPEEMGTDNSDFTTNK